MPGRPHKDPPKGMCDECGGEILLMGLTNDLEQVWVHANLDDPDHDVKAAECHFCGEHLNPRQEVAEMYNPRDEEQPSKLCHGQCGFDHEWELA